MTYPFTFTPSPTTPARRAELRAGALDMLDAQPATSSVKLSAKQREVLEHLVNVAPSVGEHYRGSYYTVGRSNGKLAATYALERKGLVEEGKFGFYRPTEAARALLQPADEFQAWATYTPPTPTVGTRVNVPKLGLADVEVIAVVPSSIAGGETRYRIRYWEAAAQAWREYGVWLEDLTWGERE